ncbi:CynX/NimT family MFS transporter [Nocardioides marmoriginsengisoli]|uniref:CynX/NimT family MFS transporter n=1 Tax=Nocardioides marmoriginsengisoli TaxID=661483 RepID=UPI001FEAA2D8|nr:MFS transporter [Nocardioides marmoriginsengisoli]
MSVVVHESRWQRALVLLGIVVLAFNLRPAAVSVGPVLDEISDSLRMGTAGTSLLTSLPVLSFATIGALAPRFARLLGVHTTTLISLVLVAVGLFARARVDDEALFLVLSFASLAGMAVANVLLPSLVKLHFPDRVGLLTALYSTSMAIGLTSASVLTVPISDASTPAGSALDWRHGLVVWGFTAVIAALPWIALVRHDRREVGEPAAFGTAGVARTRIGWLMALFFGLQSLQAYSIFGWVAQVFRDAGYSAHDAGLLLGVTTGISIPLSFVIPRLTVKVKDQRVLLSAIMVAYPIGYLGLIFAPDAGAWIWATTLGIGTCTFPFILTLIGLRARTPGGTAALSGFTQSVGYLIAVVGPFGVGALHAATDGWGIPLGILLALCVPQYLAGLAAARPVYVEDQLAGSSTSKV